MSPQSSAKFSNLKYHFCLILHVSFQLRQRHRREEEKEEVKRKPEEVEEIKPEFPLGGIPKTLYFV